MRFFSCNLILGLVEGKFLEIPTHFGKVLYEKYKGHSVERKISSTHTIMINCIKNTRIKRVFSIAQRMRSDWKVHIITKHFFNQRFSFFGEVFFCSLWTHILHVHASTHNGQKQITMMTTMVRELRGTKNRVKQMNFFCFCYFTFFSFSPAACSMEADVCFALPTPTKSPRFLTLQWLFCTAIF